MESEVLQLNHSPVLAVRRKGPSGRYLWLAACCVLLQSGCVNLLTMVGKVFLGDPMQTSAFEQATGVSLSDGKKSVLLICAGTGSVSNEFGQIGSELEEELVRRLKRHKVNVYPPDSAIDILQDHGGVFDPNVIARELDDVDYIIHIDIDHFSYKENGSSNLLRGRSGGLVTAYEVRGEKPDRHAIQVFTNEFRTEYPPTHPVPVDQVSQSVFIRRSMKHLADSLGTTFYNVRTSDLIAE